MLATALANGTQLNDDVGVVLVEPIKASEAHESFVCTFTRSRTQRSGISRHLTEAGGIELDNATAATHGASDSICIHLLATALA